ncbi:MAG TPA: GIY-YIG nuclease family protein [Vicinamibacterales bacterium]
MHGLEKRIVYILRSESNPSRHYVGITDNVDARLEWHNRGPSGHTVNHRPWSLVVTMEFRTEKAARVFEKYLKSGSGRAFTKRHFAPEGTSPGCTGFDHAGQEHDQHR